MIEKVKGLSICGRCFSKKTNLAFFPNDNDRIAIVYGKNGVSVKLIGGLRDFSEYGIISPYSSG